MAYNLSPTCFSPSWVLLKSFKESRMKFIWIQNCLHQQKHFNFYIFAFHMPQFFVNICTFVPIYTLSSINLSSSIMAQEGPKHVVDNL